MAAVRAASASRADTSTSSRPEQAARSARHAFAEKLRADYMTQIGHRPAPSEVASWQNSLMALSMLVDQAELNDHGVISEDHRGNTGRPYRFELGW